jgi:hypothetical protein
MYIQDSIIFFSTVFQTKQYAPITIIMCVGTTIELTEKRKSSTLTY